MTTFPARPSVPARPAVYVRGQDATGINDADNRYRRMLIGAVHDELSWPTPVIYADAGPPGSQLAALVEAIKAGRHDGVFVDFREHPAGAEPSIYSADMVHLSGRGHAIAAAALLSELSTLATERARVAA